MNENIVDDGKRLLGVKGVCVFMGNISRATFYRYQAAGIIPKPFVKLGRSPKWRLEQLHKMSDQMAPQ